VSNCSMHELFIREAHGGGFNGAFWNC
jgi:hypothetical protein